MPKEYLTMHDTYIISPDIKSNKTIPAFLKKTLKLSEHYQWPIVKDTLIYEMAANKSSFPTDISKYLLNFKNIELKVTKKVCIGVTPLKAWNRVRGMKIVKTTKFKRK